MQSVLRQRSGNFEVNGHLENKIDLAGLGQAHSPSTYSVIITGRGGPDEQS